MAVYGRFIPRFPEKYVGDPTKIFFRSSWEYTVMKWLDSRDNVVRWGSEEIHIPYLSPADNKVHTYIPDFFAELNKQDETIERVVIEVKPKQETLEQYAKSERDKSRLLINNAKWKAAEIFCEQRGLKFKVITQDSIFYQGQKKRGKSKIHSKKSQ